MNGLEALKDFLSKIEWGPIPAAEVSQVEKLLEECWHLFDGSDKERMEGYKLLRRTEDLFWSPPILSFKIERHGALVQGSSRAEVHEWRVDLNNNEASIVDTELRQKKTPSKREDMHRRATEIAELILGHASDERLNWLSDAEVVVNMGKIIPATNQQTTSSRRKRFRSTLVEMLEKEGWTPKGKGSQLRFVKKSS